MTLLEHAQRELELAKIDGDGDTWMTENVLELIKTFASQGHSGESAPICIQLFSRLASYKPLGPLTGEDNEWMKIAGRKDLWQNKRCSHVFKNKDGAYNIEGKVFREPNGACYTSGNSRVPVTFPYEVKDPEYIDVPFEKDNASP